MSGGEHVEKLEAEFSRALHEFHSKMSLFVSDAEEEFKTMFEQHFLAVSEQALKHMIDLIHDLNWLKNWELEVADRDKEQGV